MLLVARNARADRWGRPALLGHSNLWYIAARENATWCKARCFLPIRAQVRILVSQRLANQEGVASDAGVQGYKGARWGKETGPQFNREIDSNLRTTCGGGLNLICPSPRLALLARAFVCFCAEDHACSVCARNRCRPHCH